MVAVGAWALFLVGRAVWALPATFLGAIAGGYALACAGVPLSRVESGVGASVLVLGLLIATQARLPLAAALALVGGAAVFHGGAHAATPVSGSAIFRAGLLLATAVLHAAGVGLGFVLAKPRALACVAGGSMAVVGLVLLATAT